jgi:hypothetical protein
MVKGGKNHNCGKKRVAKNGLKTMTQMNNMCGKLAHDMAGRVQFGSSLHTIHPHPL